ncbi:MAG: hypothetical protein JNM13_07120 [Hyphomicrobiaceae bacterium]|nr:hypothetical protein [Hyphomicrobiaceae bacterium]
MTKTQTPSALFRALLDPVAPGEILPKLSAVFEPGEPAKLRHGFVMARHRFDIVTLRWAEGVFSVASHDDKGAELFDAAYEVRLFCERFDAHWQRSGADAGRLRILAPCSFDGGHQVLEVIDELHREYLLWGRSGPIAGKTGWSELREPRIRAIPLEVSPDNGVELVLKAVEHVAVGKHGNAFVVAERLTGISKFGSPAKRKDDCDE